MPHYYFHCADGVRDRDPDGTELPDNRAAQFAAIRYAGEVLQSSPKDLWTEGQWRVEVTNEQDELLFTVITLTVDAPKLNATRNAANE